jgi:hypothetical protein
MPVSHHRGDGTSYGSVLPSLVRRVNGGAVEIQHDSKLLSGFPWPVIFRPEKNKIELLREYESVTQKVYCL